MIGNPFAPHSPAPSEAFVNREREIDLIFGHIQAVQRGNVAINGPLGIGKTSLLRHVAAPATAAAYGASPPVYALVYVDVQSVSPFNADRFWRRVAQLVARLPGVDLQAPIEQLLARPVLDVIDIEELLDAVVDRRMALVLLLDEFEWALQADTPDAEAESRNFLAQMASLARRTPKVLSLVVSTEAPLFEATRVIESWRGSPFATIFTSVTLKPLTPADANELLDRALANGTVSFNDDDRRRLYKLSAGQPAALQAAAFSLYHGLQQSRGHAQLWEAAQHAALQALAFLNVSPPTEGTAAPPMMPPAATASVSAPPGTPPSPHGLWIDPKLGEVTVNGRRVESLTALEYSLLRLLYGQSGRLCSKEEIIRQVWGEEFMGGDDDSRVEKLISRLRRKIEPVPNRPQYLRTVRGRGYRYVP
ncbi:hypothetical protein DCC79_00675 [bacterium]|nr:hypothetical protein [Chloroflexi bacterium CFX6]RIL12689.1 MAG: hypothetical protein DCC79_00675 [bacterium]